MLNSKFGNEVGLRLVYNKFQLVNGDSKYKSIRICIGNMNIE